VADAEAGFGGPLNCFELMKAMIKAGAAGVHFEDQLSSEKKCGHLGGKVRPAQCHGVGAASDACILAQWQASCASLAIFP
jgi:2-methylisocitrate lyase-like PEP mutase family enzyme